MQLSWVVVVVMLFVANGNEGANILGIFTVPSKSHSILGYELFKELAKSGHQVIERYSFFSSTDFICLSIVR